MARIIKADTVDSRTLELIRNYGWAKILVGGGTCSCCQESPPHTHSDGPVYAYSIGLSLTYPHPELLVSAPADLAVALLDYAQQRIHHGERLVPGTLYHGFFAQQPFQLCQMRPVKKRVMAQAVNILHTRTFAAFQLVYPDMSGVWPWDHACAESVRHVQKLYCQTPHV